MAYLDPMLGRLAPEAAARTRFARFSPLEQAAVRIGAADCVNSIGRHPRWVRLKRVCFGFSPAPGLSNARLEAMRRLVVELRHSPAHRITTLIDEAVKAGVSEEQASALARRFGRRRRWWRWR